MASLLAMSVSLAPSPLKRSEPTPPPHKEQQHVRQVFEAHHVPWSSCRALAHVVADSTFKSLILILILNRECSDADMQLVKADKAQ